MQIRLPFHYDVEIFSECFTFYKLGMMKSHRDYDAWLFNHGGIFMNEAYNTYLGRQGQRLRMEDYAPLLAFSPIDHTAFSSDEELIAAIVGILSDGEYVMLEQGFESPDPQDPEPIRLHETVFYAVDTDKRTVCHPDLRGGVFREQEQTFEEIVEAHKRMQIYYDQHEYFARQVKETHFAFSRVKVCHEAQERPDMLRFFHMLEQDCASSLTTTVYYDMEWKQERSYQYRGSSEVLRGYREWLKTRIGGDHKERMWIRLSLGLFKYMEYVALLRRKVDILCRAGMPYDDEPLVKLQETLELLRGQALKWEMTEREAAVPALCESLDSAFAHDRFFLLDLLYHLRTFLLQPSLHTTNPFCLNDG